MGYIYAQTTTGNVLACDVCSDYPARKIKCPYGWCQATASCSQCKPRVKAFDHSRCKAASEDSAAAKREMIDGRMTLTLYECKGTFDDRRFHRIREDRASFAACYIFNKTWVDQPEIDQLRAWGNTIIMEVSQ